MDHAPAPSWLDRHLDSRPGWADAPADVVVIDPAAVVPEPTLDEPVAPSSDSWLHDATIGGLTEGVDQIEVTDTDLAADLANRDTVDDEFAIPAPPEPDAAPSLVDPFDEFVAETDTTAVTLPAPDGHDRVDDVDDVDDVDGDDIAPSATDDLSEPATTEPATTEPDVVPSLDGEHAGDTSDDGDSFDTADDPPTDAAPTDAVADGIGDLDAWTPEPGDDAPADTGYDAFDDLDEGTDG